MLRPAGQERKRRGKALSPLRGVLERDCARRRGGRGSASQSQKRCCAAPRRALPTIRSIRRPRASEQASKPASLRGESPESWIASLPTPKPLFSKQIWDDQTDKQEWMNE
ncbi:Guanine nucleotide-binding protein G(s) subunit alpha isoforms XLas [Ophiophagus hannah]|uniref:Guanine nucleotide-binding protein G(S) subunit alpha isoforms XLas n=1 Tax=Ophiophagus hannah TaxID=8665 RepID=V8NGX3_OPHHA|nr:Guanine nucleotide-binding protein G(s) subunit alpha isoforms XLas [Ophiophagus hannah]